jgi:tRNA(Ile2) C34 agmatinyltransferase TiaS
MKYHSEIEAEENIKCKECGGELIPTPVLGVTCYFRCVECELEYHHKYPRLLLSLHKED